MEIIESLKVKAFGLCIYRVNKKNIEILMCKGVSSLNKWGCVKGLLEKNESHQQCAKREFYEESSINIEIKKFEEYFEQINKEKDIGIWLVNAKNIKGLDSYFFENKLLDNYLSWENSKIKFFDINKLPQVKKKQNSLIEYITDFLRNKNQLH